ncbi:MAG: lipid-A-disaccharide synthase N-terminal domain-containing protein [Sedimentisphaerales bacterium]
MFDSLVKEFTSEPVIWTVVGLAGQFTFGGRFVIQWLASELKKQSHVPISFWYLSLVGSIIMLIYSIHRQEPIIVLGFVLNILIYVRNLHLIYIHKKTGEITPVEKDED